MDIRRYLYPTEWQQLYKLRSVIFSLLSTSNAGNFPTQIIHIALYIFLMFARLVHVGTFTKFKNKPSFFSSAEESVTCVCSKTWVSRPTSCEPPLRTSLSTRDSWKGLNYYCFLPYHYQLIFHEPLYNSTGHFVSQAALHNMNPERKGNFTPTKEPAHSSETWVDFYKTRQCNFQKILFWVSVGS